MAIRPTDKSIRPFRLDELDDLRSRLAGTRWPELILLIFTNMPFGIASATLQSLTPNQLRGRVSAFPLFCQDGFGMVCGLLIPAMLTDNLFNGKGQALAIRWRSQSRCSDFAAGWRGGTPRAPPPQFNPHDYISQAYF
jgi:hypothetical protein